MRLEGSGLRAEYYYCYTRQMAVLYSLLRTVAEFSVPDRYTERLGALAYGNEASRITSDLASTGNAVVICKCVCVL